MSLFDEPLPEQPRARASDPVTSQEAGRKQRGFPWRVLLAACKMEVFDDGLLAEAVKDDRNIVARRRLDLEDVGLVERLKDRKGQQVYAIGGKGSRVMVFRVTDAGRTKMEDELRRRGKL